MRLICSHRALANSVRRSCSVSSIDLTMLVLPDPAAPVTHTTEARPVAKQLIDGGQQLGRLLLAAEQLLREVEAGDDVVRGEGEGRDVVGELALGGVDWDRLIGVVGVGLSHDHVGVHDGLDGVGLVAERGVRAVVGDGDAEVHAGRAVGVGVRALVRVRVGARRGAARAAEAGGIAEPSAAGRGNRAVAALGRAAGPEHRLRGHIERHSALYEAEVQHAREVSAYTPRGLVAVVGVLGEQPEDDVGHHQRDGRLDGVGEGSGSWR